MKIETIASVVNGIADIKLAQDWDNVGLLVGDAMRLTFSGGIGTLENSVAELGAVDQLRRLK